MKKAKTKKKGMILKETIIFLSIFSVSGGATLLYYSLNQKKNHDNGIVDVPQIDSNTQLRPAEQLFSSITQLQKFTLDGMLNFTYGDDQLDTTLNLVGEGDISNFDDIKISADLDANVSGILAKGKLGYFDKTIYVDYNNSHIKLPQQDALDFVNILPDLGLNVALPEELLNLDLNQLTNDLQNMEPIDGPRGERTFTFDLTPDIQILFKANKENQFTGIRTNKFFYEDLYCYADFNITNVEETNLVNPENALDAPKYSLFTPAFSLIEGMHKFFGENQNTVNLVLDLKKETPEAITDVVKLDTDISYDMAASRYNLDNKIVETERIHDLDLQLSNNTLYVDHANLNKLSIENQSVIELIDFLESQITNEQLKALLDKLTSSMAGVDLEALLDSILNVNNWVEGFEVTENGLNVTLDLSKISASLNKITISLAKDQKTFTGIHISDFKFNGLIAKIDMDVKPYIMPEIAAETYVAIDPAMSLIPTLFKLVKQNEFRMEIQGLVDNDDPSIKDVEINGGVQFNVLNSFGYGDITINDSNSYAHKVEVDYREDKQILMAYNKETRAKMTNQTITDVMNFISELTQKNDAHFMELFGDVIKLIQDSPIAKVIGGDIGLLFATKGISNITVSDTLIGMDISGALLGLNDMNFHMAIRYDQDNLYGLDITNIKMNGQTISFSIDLTKFRPELQDTRLDPYATYFDFTNMRQFLDLIYNTTVPNDFHITGNVKLSLLAIINADLPLDIRVRNNKGNVSVEVTLLKIPVIPLVNTNPDYLGAKNRKVSFYYENGYIYAKRTEQVIGGKTFKAISKIELNKFLETNTLMYYLLDFTLGLKQVYIDEVNKAINAPADPNKAPMRYELLVRNFDWNKNNNYYHISLNMKELAANPKLNDLNINVMADMVQRIISGIQIDWNVVPTVNLKGQINLIDFNKPVDLTEMTNFINSMAEFKLGTVEKTCTK